MAILITYFSDHLLVCANETQKVDIIKILTQVFVVEISDT